ncbi:hypothetical protein ACFV16_31995 [Streptomyces massasporeus]|uniref:hypothetical protein n=1 Tax=Streptomyces massasporeus TaxID=67324 RepID=UPI0036A27B91
MSYDLAVWDGDRPFDNRAASSMYGELYKRYLDSDDVVVPPAPRIVAYVEALVARFPDDVARSVVWASPPVVEEASGPIVHLSMSYSKAEEVPGAATNCDGTGVLPSCRLWPGRATEVEATGWDGLDRS